MEEQNDDNIDKKSTLVFKNPNYQHSALQHSKKKIWKNLKQILTIERSYIWPEDAVTYFSIDAPPSLMPAKKYSDVSGLPAKYTDPLTKLRYADASEFQRVRDLPMDIVSGLLELRKAKSIV